MNDLDYEDYNEFNDTDFCHTCETYYCTCCGDCLCFSEDYYEDEEDE